MPSRIDRVDRMLIISSMAVHVGLMISMALHVQWIIRPLHAMYALYILIAPFIVTTFVGKVIYTSIVALQFILHYIHGHCILSYVRFKGTDAKSIKLYPEILPSEDVFVIQVVIQVALLVILWRGVA
jgi:hypothetical protein